MIEATSNRFGLDRFIPNGVIQFFKSRERLQLEETMRLLEEDIRLDEMDLAEFVFTRGERDPGSPTLIKYHVPVHGAKQRLGYTVTVQDHEQSKGFGDFVTSAHPMKGIELDLNTGIFRKCTYAHIGQERTQLFQFTQFNEEGEKVFRFH